jgi:D-alanyl-D-alanine carboxypeptidase/D-alanyl-D-alanine-endopeptidase (penicillin-binding protein 4)
MSGIDVTGEAVDVDDLPVPPTPVTVILRHRSRPLRDITVPMLKNSINMYADAILRLATGPGGSRAMADGAMAERRLLQSWDIPDGAIQPVDGSGLSRFNLATAGALVGVLTRMRDTPEFVGALPIAGVDGTLAGRMKDAPAAGNVRAKTGTMTNVRAVAGYATTRDGDTLAFAVIANNFESGAGPVTAAMDQIVVTLAAFSRR